MGQWKEKGRCLTTFRLLWAIFYSRDPRNLFNAGSALRTAIYSLHMLPFPKQGEIRGVK